MANELRAAWISKYLIEVGETYGAFLSGVPKHTRGKRAQLVEFLTYEQDTEDSCIWVRLSDKWNTIPARITSQALDVYRNSLTSYGKRLTEQRNAIVTIKGFRPLFSRVPLGAGKGLTKEGRLALDVDSIEVVGGAGEPAYGDPKDVVYDEKVRRWTEGLLQDGGGGNVLKIEKEQSKTVDRDPALEKGKRAKMPLETLLKPKQASLNRNDTPKTLSNDHRSSPYHQYKRSWKSLTKMFHSEEEVQQLLVPDEVKCALKTPPSTAKQAARTSRTSLERQENNEASESQLNLPQRMRTPPPKFSHPLDLGSSPTPSKSQGNDNEREAEPGPLQPRQTTPSRSEWSPSVHGTPESKKTQEEPSAVDNDAVNANESDDADSNGPDRDEGELDFGPSSSPVMPKQEQHDARLSQTLATHQQVAGSQPNSQLRRTSPSSAIRKHVTRKVPYPVPPKPRDPDASDPERVLVPNSDPSGSGSGSLVYSQSQSQSQSAQVLQTDVPAGLDRSQPPCSEIPCNPPPQDEVETLQDADRSYEGDRSSPDIEIEGDEGRLAQENRPERRPTNAAQGLRRSADVPDEVVTFESAEFERRSVARLPASQKSRQRTGLLLFPREDDDLSSDDQQTLAILAKSMQPRLSQKSTTHSLFGSHPISPPTSGSTVVRKRRKLGSLVASSSTSDVLPILPSSPDVFIDEQNPPAKPTERPPQGRRSSQGGKNVQDHITTTMPPFQKGSSTKSRDGKNDTAQDKPLFHDRYAWALPSFMRKGKDPVPAAGNRSTPAGNKRKRDSIESTAETAQPASKLQKVTTERKLSVIPKERSRSAQTEVLRIQPVSASSTSGARTHAKLDERQARYKVPASDQKSVASISSARIPAGYDDLQEHKATSLPEHSATDRKIKTESPARRSDNLASDVQPKKLAGFLPELGLRQEEGGPPLITWQRLTDILLQTGRIRNAALRRK
ncbi:hypothetical protein OE88DRAFT_1733591 [Heliocybe sulcata]|uniref:Telomere replication protein EST3 n=1 Tax=Heliocybe sulcata TaxID=5364 RepID=A0A5C3N8M9_9AGAM|nr:hypothetical protein OE88DRAFT_1733591 [Heliocybe sulcata]